MIQSIFKPNLRPRVSPCLLAGRTRGNCLPYYMAIETPVDQKGIYFITFTCHNWIALIEEADAYEAVYQFFEVLQKEGNAIVAYVIMPNHVHFLLHYTSTVKSLNTLIGNGKRFMAYNIVKRLQQKNKTGLLVALQGAVEAKDSTRGKKHEVWKASFDVKPCRTERFLLQKLNYIHENPVKGKWNLAINRESYEHSSCLFYFKGAQRRCEVMHYEKVLDWEGMYEE